MYRCEAIPTWSVLTGSNDLQTTFCVLSSRSLGGTIWVMYPVSSRGNADFLKPVETKDLAPKLELEFVIDWSAPSSATKWLEKPIANTETAWIKASLDDFMW